MSVYLIKSGLESGTWVCGGNTFLSGECEPVVLLFTLWLISFWQAALAPLLSSLFVFFPLKDDEMPPDIFQGFSIPQWKMFPSWNPLKIRLSGETAQFIVLHYRLNPDSCLFVWMNVVEGIAVQYFISQRLQEDLKGMRSSKLCSDCHKFSAVHTCVRACVCVPLELDEGAFRDSLQNLLPTLINKSAHTHTREAKDPGY